MTGIKKDKSFSINILFNYIFIASLITLLIIGVYCFKYKIGSKERFIWFVIIVGITFSFVLFCKIIMFFYRIVRKISPIRGNIKKYMILLIIVISLNLVTIIIDYNIQISKSKQALNYIEAYIVSNNKETDTISKIIDNYIFDYKNHDKFKNELISFSTQQVDLYVNNKVTNKGVLKDKLSSLLMMLHVIYPDIKDINYAYDKINDYSLEEIDANTQPVKSSNSEEEGKQNVETSNDSHDFLNFLSAIFPILLVLSPFIIFNVVVANLISRDAKKRNMNTLSWWCATFVFGLIAIILYVIVRDPRQDI